MKCCLAALAFTLAGTDAAAQFSEAGNDPAKVRWSRMDTPDFRLIYPRGSDSLARVYGISLENARSLVARSSGFYIGESYRSKMPVVLHNYYVIPNASVAWAPKRMDIFTVLDPYSPTPMPWATHLAIHEGRHAAQMQFGASGDLKILHWLTGEMFAGAMAGIFPGPALLEGDAVVAETALTRTGRGRQAGFLEYMMPAFDCGDWRDWYRWIYGSDKLYTPDHYRAGYMMVAGARVFFNDPMFMQRYLTSAADRFRVGNLQKTLKEASGMKLKEAYRTIQEGFHGIWTEEAAARGPFMPAVQVSGKPRMHSEYAGGVAIDGSGIFSQKKGMAAAGSLVKIDLDGNEKRIRSFASYTSDLMPDADGGRIYWSESVGGLRWTLGGSSRIRYVETSRPSKVRDLTRSGRYFNPAPSPDGKSVAVTEYPAGGGSRICLLSPEDGSVTKVYDAPDSLQFTEAVWVGERLFAAGLSNEGIGIYEVKEEDGKTVLQTLTAPLPVTVGHLRTDSRGDGPAITFLCDRTGVTELYSLNTESKVVRQMTATRYGIDDPFFNSKGDTLYYSSLAQSDNPSAYRQGKMLYATAASDLPVREVDFEDIHRYPVAEALTDQENSLALFDPAATKENENLFTEPKRYSKIRFPHIHSWAPAYFNYDNVSSLSGDEYYETASFGATAMFQNLFSTGSGMIGYNAHTDPYNSGETRHSGHFQYTFTGLFPAFELSADFNDRSSMKIQRSQQQQKGSDYRVRNVGTLTDNPYFSGTAKVYIPLNFSSGGLRRGLIPQVKYRFTNDTFNDRILLYRVVKRTDGKDVGKTYNYIGKDNEHFLQTLDFSVRGYILRSTAEAQVWPSLGIGAEAGVHTRPGLSEIFSNTAYIYTYGYLPGFTARQGLKLTASAEFSLGNGSMLSTPEGSLSPVPRGFAGTNLKSILNTCSGQRFKLTADYAIPLVDVDWTFLSPVAYIKNFVLTPFADWSCQSFDWNDVLHYNPGGVKRENLFSVGADLTVNLGNFFWLPYDAEIGIRYARNFWGNIDLFNISGLNANYIGCIFTVDL